MIALKWSSVPAAIGRRTMAAVVAGTLLVSGCYVKKVQKLPAAQIVQPEHETVVGVTTVQAQEVSFDPPGATISDKVLHAKVKSLAYDLPVDQVQRYWVERRSLSAGRTTGLAVGVTVGAIIAIVGVAAALKQSCPFVYDWDGEKWNFDAEPYGGAIAKGLEKDDYSELGQLKEVDGTYKLRMTNEVDETQMTNLTELWVVDHPQRTRVVPDIAGRLRTVGAPQQMLKAEDAVGTDLLPWLKSTDKLIWEPSSVPDAKGNLESDIIMTFPKPKDAKEVKLIANAATGLWGSYMIKKMVELHGKDLNRFYTEVNHSAMARKRLLAFEEREELYMLKVYVEEPTGWELRGILPGTGPFISKDRILPLDVSKATGDTLRVRIHPPAGFWALNSFAVDYTGDQPLKVQTVKPTTAQNLDGTSALKELTAADGRYLQMPNIGDVTDIKFVAPAKAEGAERTVFLHSRGWYKLHIRDFGEPDKKLLAQIEHVPGAAAKYAAEQFGQWKVAQVCAAAAIGELKRCTP